MSDTSSRPLDPKLGSLISDLRSRVRRYITIDSMLAAVAVIGLAFWLGFLVDWGPVKLGGTEMPRSARAVLLVAVLIALVFVLIRLFLSRITRRLPDDSLALLLERHHPKLAGRLVTAVQLNRPRQTGDMYSTHLLQRVFMQAIEASDDVDPGRVLRWKPVVGKLAIVVPVLLAMIGLAIASPGTMGQAASRLLLISDVPWPRQADLRMVGIEVPMVSASEKGNGEALRLLEFDERVVRVARGGAATLRIEAEAENSIVPEVCTVYYRTAAGLRGQANMRRVGRVRDGVQAFALDGPPLAGISEDIVLSVRGLDDRLDDYRIMAIDPPNITALDVEATYPEYLRSEGVGTAADFVTAYQPGLRLREGTSVRLVGKSSAQVASVEAAVTQGDSATEIVPVEVAEDGLTFSLDIQDVRAPTSVVMVPMDADQITAPSPYRYFLGVVADSAPNVQLRLLGIGNLVTPEVRIPFKGTATDDYGITNLTVQLAPVADQVESVVTVGAEADRVGEFDGAIDVRELTVEGKLPAPEPGVAFNIFGEATDGYDLGAAHVSRTDLLRLEVVPVDVLLAALERRELGLRTRLEQTISEMRTLRDSLDLLRREGWPTGSVSESTSVNFSLLQNEGKDGGGEESDADREVQLLRLRIQQSGLQATKTAEELRGIAASIDDILLEMINNRVDSPDRRDRIAAGVRDPLQLIVEGSLGRLRSEIDGLIPLAENRLEGPKAAGATVKTAEEVLLALEAVLEKMLDLESYNEVLDLVRGLIDKQGDLIEATEEQRKQALQDLFRGFDN